MRKIYNICEELANFFYTNISLIYFENLNVVEYSNFSFPNNFKLTLKNLEEIKNTLLIDDTASLYILNVELKIAYLSIKDIKKNFFICIGPFLIEDQLKNNPQLLYKIKKNTTLYDFYLHIKKNKINSYSGLANIVNGLINCEYKALNILVNEISFNSKVIQENFSTLKNETIKNEIVQERYLYENLVLDNIKNGNPEKALYYSKKLHEHFDFGTRMPQNQFRAKKNGAFILAGMSRKILEELNIPYFTIHFLSSKYFYQIEQSRNLKELEEVNENLIREYSEICFKQKNNSHFNDVVNKAIFYININLTKKIYIKDIADYCEVSLEHLSRTFKKQLGLSLKKYITSLKIEEALKYLDNTNFKLKDIAIKLDFSSTEIFIKNFKSVVGVTPSHYLKTKQNSSLKNI